MVIPSMKPAKLPVLRPLRQPRRRPGAGKNHYELKLTLCFLFSTNVLPFSVIIIYTVYIYKIHQDSRFVFSHP